EGGGILLQQADPQTPSRVEEKDIAGVHDSVGDVLQVMGAGAATVAVDPALGLVVVVVAVAAGVQNLGVRLDDALLQSADGGDHLEGGAGGIDVPGGPVEEGVEGVGEQLVIVLGIGGEIKGGIGGHGQHAAVPDVDNHGSPALSIFRLQALNTVG